MRGHCLTVFLLFAGFLCPSCNPASNEAQDNSAAKAPAGKYKIVTTCGMVTDIVRQVAGDRAEVVGLMNEGVDPHLYKPTRDDINTLLSADIVFYVGLMLEGRMTDTFIKVSRAGIPVHPVAEGIPESFLREPDEFEGHWDPHVWMDVSAWSQCVEYIANSLAEFDPPHADEYRSNAKTYRAELAKLHEYVTQRMASIPESQRVLVTAHDAFGYYSRAYEIPVNALQGISTESEASVDDVNQLVDQLVSRKIPAIFVESSVNQEGIKAILEGAASRGAKVKIGGELFSDAMGAPGGYTGTYIGMMDHNATTIARSLGGTAPADGLNGKLTESSH